MLPKIKINNARLSSHVFAANDLNIHKHNKLVDMFSVHNLPVSTSFGLVKEKTVDISAFVVPLIISFVIC